jgi:hypothetical protein
MELKDLGLSNEKLTELVVERIVEELHSGEGDLVSTIESGVREKAQKAVLAKIEEISRTQVEPRVGELIETLVLRPTNKYGEPIKNAPTPTFREYLIQRTEEYITEKVDYQGRPRGSDSYGWSGTQTRLTHLIHQHLHYEIEQAMKQVIGDANKILAAGLQETVKVKLAEIMAALKVKVATK